jgi:hypothetical protein
MILGRPGPAGVSDKKPAKLIIIAADMPIETTPDREILHRLIIFFILFFMEWK